MELYGSTHIRSIDEMANDDALLEYFIIDDVLRGNQEQIKNFCESEEAKILMEKQVLNKPTLHRLSKQDDLKRRVKLMAYQLAKINNDPLWAKLVKYQKLKKETAQKILNKYGTKAERMAKIAQKNYIQKAKKVQATAAEQKAQNASS
jgi:DNA-directed RNA polymerase subunit H (RpoH/RPB5)